MGILRVLRLYQENKKTPFTLEEKENISYIVVRPEEGGKAVARVFKKDGAYEDYRLSKYDQDLSFGTRLDVDKCIKIVENSIQCLHYEGLDFVKDWITVSEKPLSSYYNTDKIIKIQVFPEEFGQELKISFADGTVKKHRISYESRPLDDYETLSSEECLILKMRKFHTRYFSCIKVI